MGPLPLELGGERRIIHTDMRESGEHFFGVASINRQYVIHVAVVGEGE